MTAIKKKVQQGFTLVELLIVIALLAIIALIVIAAINPIEQRNRARDTGMKSDGAQLVSALDRFYTARAEFPWVTQDGATYDNDTPFGFESAGSYLIGLCAEDENNAGQTNCLVGRGILITTDELKPEFGDRNFIDAFIDVEPVNELYVGKEQGASESTYVCYTPLSKSNRDTACDNGEVYEMTVGVGDGDRGVPITAGDDVCDAESEAWPGDPLSGDGPLYVCIPE